jgi:hypothetical protein
MIILLVLVLFPVIFAGTGGYYGGVPAAGTAGDDRTDTVSCPSLSPVFTSPSDKLAETASPGFTTKLLEEAAGMEPLLLAPGTQVHMGFWSGRGNHGSLVFLLDAINDMSPETIPPQRAIWDEGATSSGQSPSYVTMLNAHWYERAASTNRTAIIYGRAYPDPYTVTFMQADDIWGQYSMRYAGMAGPIRNATGKPVNVWCFVEGARATRIFYTYELPELRSLEENGAVHVYFAKTKTANWTVPSDWIAGTKNAPVPRS